MNFRERCLLILGVCAVMSFHAVAYGEALPVPEEIAAVWQASLDKIHSLHRVERVSSTTVPYDDAAFRDPASVATPSPDDVTQEIWWQDGKLRAEYPEDGGGKRTVLHDGERTTDLVSLGEERTAQRAGGGHIGTPPVVLADWLAVLRRGLNAECCSVTLTRDDSGRAVLHLFREGELERSLVLAPDRNWAVVEDTWYWQREDIEGMTWAAAPAVQPGHVQRREIFQDFQEVAPGVYLPLRSFVGIAYGFDLDLPRLKVSQTAQVLAVNESLNPQLFSLVLPQGTRVLDFETIGPERRYTVGPFGMKLTQDTVIDTLEEKAVNIIAGWLD